MRLTWGLCEQYTMDSGTHFCPFCQGPRLPFLASTPALGNPGPFHSEPPSGSLALNFSGPLFVYLSNGYDDARPLEVIPLHVNQLRPPTKVSMPASDVRGRKEEALGVGVRASVPPKGLPDNSSRLCGWHFPDHPLVLNQGRYRKEMSQLHTGKISLATLTFQLHLLSHIMESSCLDVGCFRM